MHNRILAIISHYDSLELFAVMLGGGGEKKKKVPVAAAAVTLVCTYSKNSYRISCLQKHLMYSKLDSQTMLSMCQ